MTRINCVPPRELSVKHLVAEYRELPRVFALVRKRQACGQSPGNIPIPVKYRMGPGHVTFFFDKLAFLVKRQTALIAEMKRRGYKPRYTNITKLTEGLAACWLNDWKPTSEAQRINRARIKERQSANLHQA
jgi:deoxyribonuclease (pyrimidine dimer)